MATAFIFHGLGGSPQANWFPWLKAELEAAGLEVIVPAFPNPDAPTLQAWMDHFVQYEHLVNDESIIIGHSLGGAFALRLLERRDTPIRAAFLVASVYGPMGNELDPRVSTFNAPLYAWSKIHRAAKEFHIIHSNDDPRIPLQQAEKAAARTGTHVEMIEGGKHLNAAAGFTEFPYLRAVIVRTLI